MGFNHSVKVPTQYKKVAGILKNALETNKSIKTLIFEEKHARMRGSQAVLKQYIDNRGAIDEAIEKSKIIEENPRLCPILCKILVTEIIFGLKELKGESKPVQTVRRYQGRLLEILGTNNDTTELENKKDAKPRYVRINTNLLSVPEAFEILASESWRQKEYTSFETYNAFLEAIKSLEEDEFMLDMHVENLLIFHGQHKHYWATHYLVRDKKLMLQDKGTSLVAQLLQPTVGSVVLDMCAAPGMKTIHISNLMENQGKIYSIELSRDRYNLLCNMTNTAGCEIVETINADAISINSERCPNVEYILIDPSCSGSGMQNRMSLNPDDKNPHRLFKLAGLQIKMLTHAMRNFPNVKRIAYSTCSIYEEENEQVVRRCLELNPHFKLLSGKKALRKIWQSVGNTDYKKIGKNCIYTRPNDDLSDGIFIAIFEKIRDESDQ